jgi:hypothetical protein
MNATNFSRISGSNPMSPERECHAMPAATVRPAREKPPLVENHPQLRVLAPPRQPRVRLGNSGAPPADQIPNRA